jgi:hypothetical protein
MEPTRDSHATLVDLLDRVLDKGLVLDADLIIHVAGIPLLGVNLRAYLAGIETMLRYGIWQDWDEAQRAAATEEQRRKGGVPLSPGEEIVLKMFASQWCANGIYHSWRPGFLYITDRKLVLYRKEPAEVLFQCPYQEIRGAATEKKADTDSVEEEYLYLLLGSGNIVRLHPTDALAAKNVIEECMKAMRLELEEISLPEVDETAGDFHRVRSRSFEQEDMTFSD